MDRIRPVDIIIMLRKLQKQLMLTVINDVERVSDLLIQIKNNRGSYLINSMQNECQTLCRVSVVFILSKILTCPGLNGLKFSMQSLKKLYYIFFLRELKQKFEGKFVIVVFIYDCSCCIMGKCCKYHLWFNHSFFFSWDSFSYGVNKISKRELMQHLIIIASGWLDFTPLFTVFLDVDTFLEWFQKLSLW